ncbi:MAG: hypothetical protein HY842_01330 [Bacteroidetes bacterium]|nr:hypothetical protein [Bacteroidota bacterium]
MVEVNSIKEIYKGHFQVILDYPSPSDLGKILSKDYKYVWCISHEENRTNWSDYDYFMFGKRLEGVFVQARNIKMELILETDEFIELIPFINQTIKIIQTNVIPPSYLDIERLSGKGKYDLLRDKIGYLFELEMPGAIDFAPIVSPSLSYLKSIIDKF